jgi:hypothetical protein
MLKPRTNGGQLLNSTDLLTSLDLTQNLIEQNSACIHICNPIRSTATEARDQAEILRPKKYSAKSHIRPSSSRIIRAPNTAHKHPRTRGEPTTHAQLKRRTRAGSRQANGNPKWYTGGNPDGGRLAGRERRRTHLLAEHGGVLELGEGRHGCLSRGGLEALLCGRKGGRKLREIWAWAVGGRGVRSGSCSLCLLWSRSVCLGSVFGCSGWAGGQCGPVLLYCEAHQPIPHRE